MTELSVGKEVLSYCGKCKLTLAHTIVTMKATGALGKCECRTCKATHVYKDPSKVKASRVKAKTGTKKQSTQESISNLWLEAVNNASTKSQKYAPKEKFCVKDIIDHAKFGPGVVERLIDNDKIEVIFRHEIKTLIHNR